MGGGYLINMYKRYFWCRSALNYRFHCFFPLSKRHIGRLHDYKPYYSIAYYSISTADSLYEYKFSLFIKEFHIWIILYCASYFVMYCNCFYYFLNV